MFYPLINTKNIHKRTKGLKKSVNKTSVPSRYFLLLLCTCTNVCVECTAGCEKDVAEAGSAVVQGLSVLPEELAAKLSVLHINNLDIKKLYRLYLYE